MSSPGGGDIGEFFGRVRRILIAPSAEWAEIERERTSIAAIYLDHLLLLAALAPLATVLHSQLLLYGVLHRDVWPSLRAALADAGLAYAVNLLGVLAAAIVVTALVPIFGGERDLTRSVKLVAYGTTPWWLASILIPFPKVAMLGVLGLYSVVLIWRGLPTMMHVPQRQVFPFVATLGVGSFLVWFVAVGPRFGGEETGFMHLFVQSLKPAEPAFIPVEPPPPQSNQPALPGVSPLTMRVPSTFRRVGPDGSMEPDPVPPQSPGSLAQAAAQAAELVATVHSAYENALPTLLNNGLARSSIDYFPGRDLRRTVGGAQTRYSDGERHITVILSDDGPAGVSTPDELDYEPMRRIGTLTTCLSNRFHVRVSGIGILESDLRIVASSINLGALSNLPG